MARPATGNTSPGIPNSSEASPSGMATQSIWCHQETLKKPWRSFWMRKPCWILGPIFRHQNSQGKLDHQLEDFLKRAKKIVFWQKRLGIPLKLAWYLPKNSQRARHLQKFFSFEGMFNTGLFICRAPKPCSLHEFWSSENKMDWLTGMILTRSSTKNHAVNIAIWWFNTYLVYQYDKRQEGNSRMWKHHHVMTFSRKKKTSLKTSQKWRLQEDDHIALHPTFWCFADEVFHGGPLRTAPGSTRGVGVEVPPGLKLFFCISAVNDWRLRFVIIYVLYRLCIKYKKYIYISQTLVSTYLMDSNACCRKFSGKKNHIFSTLWQKATRNSTDTRSLSSGFVLLPHIP